jgi:hypothetical protein
MSCINVREGDGLVQIIKLDQCGAPALGAGNLLRMTTVSEFGFEDTVEEGDTVTERNFGGRKCYTDVGQDELTSVAVNMTTCGINPGARRAAHRLGALRGGDGHRLRPQGPRRQHQRGGAGADAPRHRLVRRLR